MTNTNGMGKAAPIDWTLLVSLALIWGLSFPIIAIALETIPPMTTVMVRMVMAAIGFLIILRATGKQLPKGISVWLHMIAIGIVGNCIPFFVITWGQEEVSAGATGILMAIVPLTTVVLAHFFASERMTRNKVIGFSIGFVGIGVLLGPQAFEMLVSAEGGNLVRKLAILFGALCYAAAAIITRRLQSQDPMAVATGSVGIGAVVMIPVTLLHDQPWTITPDMAGWVSLIYLGILATLVGNMIYFTIISRVGAGFYAYINYMIPIISIITGAIMLAERLPISAYAALGLILIGLFVGQRQAAKAA